MFRLHLQNKMYYITEIYIYNILRCRFLIQAKKKADPYLLAGPAFLVFCLNAISDCTVCQCKRQDPCEGH